MAQASISEIENKLKLVCPLRGENRVGYVNNYVKLKSREVKWTNPKSSTGNVIKCTKRHKYPLSIRSKT